MNIRYSVQAVLDFEDGHEFYALRSEAAATNFVTAVESAIKEAAENPTRFAMYEAAPLEGGVRRNLVQRYPYSVVYQAIGDTIEIVAIAHASREPGYWTRDK